MITDNFINLDLINCIYMLIFSFFAFFFMLKSKVERLEKRVSLLENTLFNFTYAYKEHKDVEYAFGVLEDMIYLYSEEKSNE